jgi:cyclophilin family peptidyl-prolyl cis-trans isomerase
LKNLLTALLLLLLPAVVQAQSTFVWIQTDQGPLLVRMDTERTPLTVANFLSYVDEDFYDGMLFHRIVNNFVVQSGAFLETGLPRSPSRPPVASERNNDTGNRAGTISLALTGNPSNPESGQAGFFFNLQDNSATLDAQFTAFGEIAFGIGTLLRMNALTTTNQQPLRPPYIQFAVRTTGFPIMPLHSGSWFDPANPRRGFVLEIVNDASDDSGPLANVYWYDYSAGEQLWATGLAPFEYGASVVTIPLLVTEGGQFGQAYDPSQVVVDSDFGTLTLRFSGCATGQFSYQTRLGNGSAPVTRLTIPTGPGDSCLDN